VDSRDVTREIRRVVWPVLRAEGFDSFTGRFAWRYVESAVDVLNFQSFTASVADGVGCTPFSFGLNLGVWCPVSSRLAISSLTRTVARDRPSLSA
jgi:hypothetical protein